MNRPMHREWARSLNAATSVHSSMQTFIIRAYYTREHTTKAADVTVGGGG